MVSEGLALEEGSEVMIAKDSEGYAERVVHLLKNPECWRTMVAAGRKRAELTFDWEQLARRLCEICTLMANAEPSA